MIKINLFCIVLIGVITASIISAVNAMGVRSMGNKLSGHIEILLDNNTIKRIDLATDKAIEMLSQERSNYLYTFDISPDGKERVLKTDEGVLLYSTSDKKLNNLIRKSDVSSFPSFSPDGKSVAYLLMKYEKEQKYGVGDSFLYIIKTNGTSDRKISALSCQQAKPSWFPDGKKIAVGTIEKGISSSRNTGIYIIDIETGIGEKIIDSGTSPAISHFGGKIVYLSEEFSDGSVSVLIYDMGTKITKTIIKKLFTRSDWPLIWSPDDKYILYTDNKFEHHDVYILNIETGKKEKITYGVAMGWR